jgi:hypothetical protein
MKRPQWVHGSVMWAGRTIMVQENKGDWYATIVSEGLHSMHRVDVMCGPFRSQKEAEGHLCDWLEGIVRDAAQE